MLVRAKRLGFYGGRRRKPGDEFEIVEPHEEKVKDKFGKEKTVMFNPFSSRWMEKVETEESKAKATEPIVEEPVEAETPTGDVEVL